MKNFLILPETWARTLCPLSSSTRNMAFRRASITVPSTVIPSSFATDPPISFFRYCLDPSRTPKSERRSYALQAALLRVDGERWCTSLPEISGRPSCRDVYAGVRKGARIIRGGESGVSFCIAGRRSSGVRGADSWRFSCSPLVFLRRVPRLGYDTALFCRWSAASWLQLKSRNDGAVMLDCGWLAGVTGPM